MGKILVLFVDDEADYLSLMKERVESWDYEVILAQSGKEALPLIKEKHPDIVVLDYLMPGMDGTAVLKEIRRFNRDLPVIMFTAHANVKNIKGASDLGVSAFVPKISIYSSDIQATLRPALDIVSKKIKESKG
ncbi:MAG: response regulator [Candidatus Omnitrophota bacterium]